MMDAHPASIFVRAGDEKQQNLIKHWVKSENSQSPLSVSLGFFFCPPPPASMKLTLSKLLMLPMLPKRPRIRLAPW